MTEDEFRRHRDGEGSTEDAVDFFHMFMKKTCGASAQESDELFKAYVDTMVKDKMRSEDDSEPEQIPEPKQEEKIVLKETEYEVL